MLYLNKKWSKLKGATALQNSAAVKLPVEPPMAVMSPVLLAKIEKKSCVYIRKINENGKNIIFSL